MIIYLWYRISILARLVAPRRVFLATYRPATAEERIQSERERNVVRRAAWELRKLTSGRK